MLSLLPEVEFLDEFAILLDPTLLQVIKKLAAASDELEKPASRREVFLVDLEVLGQRIDAFCEERDLYFRNLLITSFFVSFCSAIVMTSFTHVL